MYIRVFRPDALTVCCAQGAAASLPVSPKNSNNNSHQPNHLSETYRQHNYTHPPRKRKLNIFFFVFLLFVAPMFLSGFWNDEIVIEKQKCLRCLRNVWRTATKQKGKKKQEVVEPVLVLLLPSFQWPVWFDFILKKNRDVFTQRRFQKRSWKI